MNPADATVLQIFPNTTAAEFAASQLRVQGIECWISSDDGGGMYPPFGTIKLLVAPADAERAREFLTQSIVLPDLPSEQTQVAESKSETAPPHRVYKFNSGMLVGIFVGALLHFGYTYFKEHLNGPAMYDADRDGVPDQEIVWRNGKAIEQRFDRNGDNRFDYWVFFQNDRAVRCEWDDDFDGRVDGWLTYSSHSFPSRTESDTDNNGNPDVIYRFTNGILAQADWKPNGTNVVLLRQLFRHGVLKEQLRDSDGDGAFDVSVAFNAFNTPIATNYLPSATVK
jgi:hypothetical protein